MSGTTLDKAVDKNLGIIFTSQSPVYIDAKPHLGLGEQKQKNSSEFKPLLKQDSVNLYN